MNERLYRSRDDRVIAGVAAGVADLLNLDPSLVRVLWVILAIMSGGILFLLYIVMMIVVPEEPFDWSTAPDRYTGPAHGPAPSNAGWTSPGSAWGSPTNAPASPQPGTAMPDAAVTAAPAAATNPVAEDTTIMTAQDTPPTAAGPTFDTSLGGTGTSDAASAPGQDASLGGTANPNASTTGWTASTPGSSGSTGAWNAAPGWSAAPPSGDWRSAREAERWARREQRRARRAERWGRSDGFGAVIFGVLLILVGGFFLLRTYYPSIDTDQLWPIILVVLGAVLVVGSFRPGASSKEQ